MNKEEITRLIEYALEPISGKVLSFGEPCEMRHRSRYGNEPERLWTETLYPIIIKTKSGESYMTLSSLYINKLEDAVWRVCSDLIYTGNLSEEEQQKVLIKIYSQEFLELRKGK